MKTVHLGYEVGTGKPVEIPIAHMVVTGQTQQAGKTTTLEALISRAGMRAVTFITKRGEGSFRGGRRMAPFFRERADWVFVSSLIDATLCEKNKLLRAWLMKVCRNTKTLAEVQKNVVAAKASARGFSESIYTEIEGYLELVVPQLAQLPPAGRVDIGPGLNVMDLAPYSTELQALVMRSVLEHVYDHEDDVITVIPEAWEFLPEGRGSPVKREAETLIRKGAGLNNFVWLDSQDLAGVWKIAVRACAVVLIGVQREANEIKRTLANIPAGISKPSASDIAHLDLGQFYACWGKHTIKTYVQPEWMTQTSAVGVAVGQLGVGEAKLRRTKKEVVVTEERAKQLEEENQKLTTTVKRLEREIRRLTDAPQKSAEIKKAESLSFSEELLRPQHEQRASLNGSFEEIKRRLIEEAPAIIKLLASKPEIDVKIERKTVEATEGTLFGRMALFISEGFFNTKTTGSAAFSELQRRGFRTSKPNVYKEADKLALLGFLRKEPDGYLAVEGMKVNIIEA